MNSFEEGTRKILENHIPWRYLYSVPVFHPTAFLSRNGWASEIDFLLHKRDSTGHTIIILECKACPISSQPDRLSQDLSPSGEWWCHYAGDKSRNLKDQVTKQRKALLAILEPPLDRKPIRVEAWVVSNKKLPANLQQELTPDFKILLCDTPELQTLLNKYRETFVSVDQSSFLSFFQQGVPVLELGHPELANAITYCTRCRRILDTALLDKLRFPVRKLAITGAAGTGKSVLLAYAAAVLATDHVIELSENDATCRVAKDVGAIVARSRVKELSMRNILICGSTRKQSEALETTYQRIMSIYQGAKVSSPFRTLRPTFKIWTDSIDYEKYNVLLVDEAHDLSADHQSNICSWASVDGRFLVVNCDRQQQLRFVGSDRRIINGLDFSGQSIHLDRNYRSSFSVYAASIAMLFRWFAVTGPKIVPTKAQLTREFGFQHLGIKDNRVVLQMRDDTHPGNNWHNLVASFPSPELALEKLKRSRLGKEEVLWVRFCAEDRGFDYEQLGVYIYVNLCTNDADELINKYIKGLEFSVVVVEGTPACFGWNAAVERFGDNENAVRATLTARRLFYLVASRANVFLYFVSDPRSNASINDEFKYLLKQASRSPKIVNGEGQKPAGKVWELQFHDSNDTRLLESYIDLKEKLKSDGNQPEVLGKQGQGGVFGRCEHPPAAQTLARHRAGGAIDMIRRLVDEFGYYVHCKREMVLPLPATIETLSTALQLPSAMIAGIAEEHGTSTVDREYSYIDEDLIDEICSDLSYIRVESFSLERIRDLTGLVVISIKRPILVRDLAKALSLKSFNIIGDLHSACSPRDGAYKRFAMSSVIDPPIALIIAMRHDAILQIDGIRCVACYRLRRY